MQDRVLKEFERKACGGEMLEKTLGVADGTITDEKKRDAVFGHIAHCPSCLDAFKEYEPQQDSVEALHPGERKGLLEIAFSLLRGFLVPAAGHFLIEPSGVPVMGREKPGLLEYRVPFSKMTLTLRIIPTGDTFTIEVPAEKSKIRFYLMGMGTCDTASPHDGVAAFRKVRPGIYVLSRDYRDFVAIKVDERKDDV